MKVKELIALLQKEDPDRKVVSIAGTYPEMSYDYITTLRKDNFTPIITNPDFVEYFNTMFIKGEQEEVVVIEV